MATWVEFAAIKQAVALGSVLERYRIEGLRRSGKVQYRGRCPIHRGDGQDAFQVNLDKQVFHCFSCGAGGTVLDFVAAMEGCGLREAALKLISWFGVSAWDPKSAARPVRIRQLVTKKERDVGSVPLSFVLRGVDPRHPYLKGRGIAEPTAAAFGVGFYAGPGLLHGRLVFPIHNEAGQLMGYGGRSVDGGQPRYKFAAGFAKSQVLFNLHRTVVQRAPVVIVVEGFFDCLKVHQAGFRSVVALMGAALSGCQEKLLTRYFQQVILMLDGDETGRRASVTIARRLAGKCSVRVVELAGDTQPDQLPTEFMQVMLEGKGGNRTES